MAKKFTANLIDIFSGSLLSVKTAHFNFDYIGDLSFANVEMIEFKVNKSFNKARVLVKDFSGFPIFFAPIDETKKAGEMVILMPNNLIWKLNFTKNPYTMK